MRKQGVVFFVVFLVSVAIAVTLAWGAVYKNLETNKAATAKIKALDKKFFKGFVVYSAGTKESPTALFFDLKSVTFRTKKSYSPVDCFFWAQLCFLYESQHNIPRYPIRLFRIRSWLLHRSDIPNRWVTAQKPYPV